MKKTTLITALSLISLTSSFGLSAESNTSQDFLFSTDGITYVQNSDFLNNKSYPCWNPADSACSLHPTNAIALAIESVGKSIPEIKSWRLNKLSLETHHRRSDTYWFYNVRLTPILKTKKAVRPISIIVGINSDVPAIEKMTNEEWKEIRKKRREIIRKNLQDYQQEVLRKGLPPLPVPLTDKTNINTNLGLKPIVITPGKKVKAQDSPARP